MPLGMKVGVGPGDIVIDADPAPPKRGTAPHFRPTSIVAKWSPVSATADCKDFSQYLPSPITVTKIFKYIGVFTMQIAMLSLFFAKIK